MKVTPRWRRALNCAVVLAGALTLLASARAHAAPDRGEPPPPEALPPLPPEPPPPLAIERARLPPTLRHGLHLGMSFGLEVAREREPVYASGAGAQLGWELYWGWLAIEAGVSINVHGDETSMPKHGFWEAHPIGYLKLPFKHGVWELLAGYGQSRHDWHDGWLDAATSYHIGELGLEDRTRRWFSRLFARGYLPLEGAPADATVVVGVSVGLFHLL